MPRLSVRYVLANPCIARNHPPFEAMLASMIRKTDLRWRILLMQAKDAYSNAWATKRFHITVGVLEAIGTARARMAVESAIIKLRPSKLLGLEKRKMSGLPVIITKAANDVAQSICAAPCTFLKEGKPRSNGAL
jgi:hypothetical protein